MKRLIILSLFLYGGICHASIYTMHTDYVKKSATLLNPHQTIAIIGTGYVGLVTGTGLAECGNQVVCADVDATKIELLKKGISPIYEPGLSELMTQNIACGRLSFTSNVAQAIHDADIIFIAVGTPMDDDGSADLRALCSVVKTIASVIDSHKIIITKSTVPVGSGAMIRRTLENDYHIDGSLFDVVSNPEFLREGSAVKDFLEPDRIVIGAESMYACDRVCEIYKHIISRGIPYVLTNLPTAEIIKYAANAFLATKLSFINEIANLCDATGGDVGTVSVAMGLDHRISPSFLNPGPGYGGSCFPKDTQALLHIAEQYRVAINTVQGAITTNNTQQHIPVQKLSALMKHSLREKTVALLGLAFKANTDDIRYSPAITAIKQLIEQGACIRAYDPQAMKHMATLFPNVTYCSSAEEALLNADALIIMTEWDEFKYLNAPCIAKLMKGRHMIDARNLLDLHELRACGFICDGIGQGGMHN